MSDKGFYTPKQYQTPSTPHFKTPLPPNSNQDIFATPMGGETSDSEESIASSSDGVASHGTASSKSGELAILEEFDDLMRCVRHRRCNEVEDAFLEQAGHMKEIHMQWQIAVRECQRLQSLLDVKTVEYNKLEWKLGVAQKVLDQEKKKTREVEREADELVRR